MAIIKQEDHRSSHHHYNHHLHSVQQSSRITKKPLPLAAPSAPQPKVYKVKPIHFRELVQQLTGAQNHHQQQQPQQQPRPQPQARPRRSNNLQVVAPPPQPLYPHQLQLQLQSQSETRSKNSENKEVKCKVEEEQKYKPLLFGENNNKMQSSNNGVGTTELILSPNFQAWFSFAMLSPGSAALSQMQ